MGLLHFLLYILHDTYKVNQLLQINHVSLLNVLTILDSYDAKTTENQTPLSHFG